LNVGQYGEENGADENGHEDDNVDAVTTRYQFLNNMSLPLRVKFSPWVNIM
jgi:hypothetical protein